MIEVSLYTHPHEGLFRADMPREVMAGTDKAVCLCDGRWYQERTNCPLITSFLVAVYCKQNTTV